MVTADAVIHGDRERLIGFSDVEHPLVLQLGGNEPEKLAEAERIAAHRRPGLAEADHSSGRAHRRLPGVGYDEVNINCGCPSDRVQSGAFGACLMAQPQTVADCVAAMRAAVSIPVTVKCRIAIDDLPARETLFTFVETVAAAGCEVFTVHARKAWLKGLSPKENRDIPPLDYKLVADLKATRPDLTIILNGGIATLDDAARHLTTFDGVMLGRAAYQTPALLARVDAALSGGEPVDVFAALEAYRPYMAAQLEAGTGLHAMTRHMLGLFNGQPGARLWRRTLSENAPRAGAGLDVLDAALATVRDRMPIV